MTLRTPAEIRAKELEQLLQHPLMREAFETAQASLYARWMASQTPEEREKLFAQVQALDLIHDFFQAVMEEGDQARVEREQDEADYAAQKAAEKAADDPEADPRC